MRSARHLGISIAHVVLATLTMAAATVHAVQRLTDAQPHISLVLLAVFVGFGVLAALSLAYPARLRAVFFGSFATLMLVNALYDLVRFGPIPHLYVSYVLEAISFAVSVGCLVATRSRTDAPPVPPSSGADAVTSQGLGARARQTASPQ